MIKMNLTIAHTKLDELHNSDKKHTKYDAVYLYIEVNGVQLNRVYLFLYS